MNKDPNMNVIHEYVPLAFSLDIPDHVIVLAIVKETPDKAVARKRWADDFDTRTYMIPKMREVSGILAIAPMHLNKVVVMKKPNAPWESILPEILSIFFEYSTHTENKQMFVRIGVDVIMKTIEDESCGRHRSR